MNWAHLDDGRAVVVDSSRQMTRQVKGESFFLNPNYVTVLLDGQWQTVRRDRLKNVPFGSPFTVLKS